ncbi:ADP-ribose pyrophosphatase YjhB, NUDIX family [Novosphingobium sp. CF614]|uniref:NUDIX domain-containing protein n=1 Tax=Novosphingobium sp. CF614 TaxID=1884364 RepID=UPI0008F4514E|nr:NUDIX domain-containing protein [Novosphingobium sp. CF614]SFG47749.1 ADP-ribose pyrophosphatase YjhB, NUDIX family [Novosphingobium sp. CF614]
MRLAWLRRFRATVYGCRIIALDEDGRVLLLRQTYGRDCWLAPGGGMRSGEDALETSRRELAEETNCTLVDARLVEELVEDYHGLKNVVQVVVGRVQGAAVADRREVREVAWFDRDALPDALGSMIHEGLERWIATWESGGG